ncbi:50S ribosomal protein L24e [Candidatus Altiarchaeota archaeon]
MNCTFCGVDISSGKEKIYVNKKGKALYFCSGKCEKNMLKLKRKARNLKWTNSYEKTKGGPIKEEVAEEVKDEDTDNNKA